MDQQQNIISTISELKNWYKSNAEPAYELIKEGAEQQQLKKLREETHFPELNSDLQVLLEQINGGLQMHEKFITLSTEDIIELNEVNAVSGYWKNNYLTFAQDSDDNYLIIENDTGKVISWNNDEGIQEPMSDTLKLYLEKLRDGVQNKELVYEEEFGLIEETQ